MTSGTQISFKTAGVVLTVLLAVAFAFGRFSAPEKVRIEKEIKVVESERKDTNKNTNTEQDKTITETETVRPDGTILRTKVTQSERKTKQNVTQTVDKTSDQQSKELKIVQSGSKTTVSIMGGVKLTGYTTLELGAHITRPVLGPFTIGLWGLRSGVVGASVGLQF